MASGFKPQESKYEMCQLGLPSGPVHSELLSPSPSESTSFNHSMEDSSPNSSSFIVPLRLLRSMRGMADVLLDFDWVRWRGRNKAKVGADLRLSSHGCRTDAKREGKYKYPDSCLGRARTTVSVCALEALKKGTGRPVIFWDRAQTQPGKRVRCRI